MLGWRLPATVPAAATTGLLALSPPPRQHRRAWTGRHGGSASLFVRLFPSSACCAPRQFNCYNQHFSNKNSQPLMPKRNAATYEQNSFPFAKAALSAKTYDTSGACFEWEAFSLYGGADQDTNGMRLVLKMPSILQYCIAWKVKSQTHCTTKLRNCYSG
jgi:hypothetical protein